MDREQAQAAWMDVELTALLTRWQGAILLTRPEELGTLGTTLWQVCYSLKDWPGYDRTRCYESAD